MAGLMGKAERLRCVINAISGLNANSANNAISAINAIGANSANNALQSCTVVVVVGREKGTRGWWDGPPLFLLCKKERGSMLVEFGFVEHQHRRLFFDRGLEGLSEA